MWTIEQVLNALELRVGTDVHVDRKETSERAIGTRYLVHTTMHVVRWYHHIQDLKPRHVELKRSGASATLYAGNQPICIAVYETARPPALSIEILHSSATTASIAQLYNVFGGVNINEMDTTGEIRVPLFESFIDALKVKF